MTNVRIIAVSFIIAISISFCEASLAITSFNVGQGNCTLVRCKELQAPMILVDAGSSTYRKPDAGEGKLILGNIANIILRQAGKYGSNLQVIVSHPDCDHYNWIERIVLCLENKVIVSKVILGGMKNLILNHFVSF